MGALREEGVGVEVVVFVVVVFVLVVEWFCLRLSIEIGVKKESINKQVKEAEKGTQTDR